MIDPQTSLAFSMFENKGLHALLLGSGVSRAAEIPTGWEITLDLIRRIAVLRNVTGEPDWAAWYRKETGSEPAYSKLLNEATTVPYERRSILHKYIEPGDADRAEGRKSPTKAHKAIAWLVSQGYVKVIITTNFDRLLENAVTGAGIVPTVIKSDDDLQGGIPLAHSSCYLVKVHGDYLDSRIRNTEDELSSYSSATDALLDRILDEYGLIVCGWSGDWDIALRAAITRAPNRRFPTFWALRGAASAHAQELITDRRAQVIQIADADGFFHNLQQSLIDQESANRPHPRTVAAIVTAAKRYIVAPELRIQLNDLISAEVRAFKQGLSESNLQMFQFDETQFHGRVATYDALMETLIRIAGIIGHWGGDHHHRLLRELFRDISHLKMEGGNSYWLNLRAYPAILLFFAYGLAATYAHNYTELYRWFAQDLYDENGSKKKAILLLSLYSDSLQGAWRKMPGHQSSGTPLSEYICEQAATWTGDYLVSGTHCKLFDTFEMCMMIGHMTLKSSPERLAQLHSTDQIAPMPASRIRPTSLGSIVLLAEFDSPDYRRQLLEAGFCKGDSGFLESAVENIKRRLFSF